MAVFFKFLLRYILLLSVVFCKHSLQFILNFFVFPLKCYVTVNELVLTVFTIKKFIQFLSYFTVYIIPTISENFFYTQTKQLIELYSVIREVDGMISRFIIE